MERTPAPLDVRILSRVRIDTRTGCWNWTMRTDPCGYGLMTLRRGKFMNTHRASYMTFRTDDPLRPGLVLDHLCRNRRCCNPWHMEQVTIGENTRRGVLARKLAATN